jgi:chromate transporter
LTDLEGRDLPAPEDTSSLREVMVVALRLGLTSFGGPVAHLGYFRREYVERRRWLDASTYADLVAMCQVLPGPASSELGIAIGTLRAGYLGGLAAWLGFTLPSAVALTLFALLSTNLDLATAGWVEGLKLAAVAVVAQAVYLMARTMTPDVARAGLAVGAMVAMLLAPTPALQVVIIAAGAVLGWRFLVAPPAPSGSQFGARSDPRIGLGLLVALGLLLLVLPIAAALTANRALAVTDAFVRTGALVFGGGHVVLPLLHAAVVTPGWIGNDRFLAGYSVAQAVPGPLFTFAAFLGASFEASPNGIAGALLALGAIFLPAFLLVWGVLPFWDRLRRSSAFASAIQGTNAAVVGILLAALITPIGTGALHDPLDVVVAALALVALVGGRAPPVAVVAVAALAGQLFGLT